jgi:two-component system, OmpR family, phosphate regulon sensor histidine kinase PhoR
MLGLRGRMALTAVAATAAALLGVLFLVTPSIRARTLEQASHSLEIEALLMARVVEGPLRSGVPTPELDRLVDDAARQVRARVTIIAPDGRVLADSAVSGPELLAIENHAGRPEVKQALAEGRGVVARHSTTVDQDLLYAAVPIRAGGQLLGVSRLAASLRVVDDQVSDLRRAMAVAAALAFFITVLLSAVLSASLSAPLRQIMEAARLFAAGDLGARSRVQRADELGELASILNRSADQLQSRITEVARDRARTEAILAAMEDGVLAVDHRGVVLLANDSLRRSLHLPDPLGRHSLEVVRQREVADLLQDVLRSGERRQTEVEMRHPRRVFALTGVPFPGDSGTPHGAVLTFHDVTERRRVDQIRRDFVANASHELRTPLTSIRGFVEALEDGAVSEPGTATRFLGKIRTHADRMAALVEDLLELSRVESGARPPRLEEVAPSEVAEDVCSFFGDLAARKRIDLACRDLGALKVTTDPERLRRILDNLVDNAIKYTPEGGHVVLSTSPGDQGGVLCEVSDDGPGISPEHLPRIFERFYRVDKARSRELGGTGLGLAIVRHLAEGMGASVTVASEVGVGSRFRVSLPARPETTRAGAPR